MQEILYEYDQGEKVSVDGYEAMHMLRKGQVKRLAPTDVRANVKFIENLFGIAA